MEEKVVFKIISLGYSGVGKTSIIKRYVYDIFDEHFLSTIGLSFYFKNITLKNEKQIKLRFIDMGDREGRPVKNIISSNIDAVVFIFALNNLYSLEKLKEFIKLFNENNKKSDNVIKYLVGNKSDLEQNIEQSLIDEFSNNYNLKYHLISAKYNISINELFQEMGEDLYNNYIKFSGNRQKVKTEKTKSEKHCFLM